MTIRGGVIAAVEPDSPAGNADLRAGDVVESAEGHPLTDVLAWSWASADDRTELTVSSADGRERTLELWREPGESWGVEFEGVVFDGIRTCRNDCTFCFLGGLPSGLRTSLYLRDDDYRLSFLFGNFVTLTNLADADMARIVEMRLTPLYVSVHASSPEVRQKVLCPRGEDRGLERLDELLEAGIEVHAQIVLVAGVNDGPVLEATLDWLAVRPGIVSVGVVPASSTRYAPQPAGPLDSRAAEDLLDLAEPWRTRMRAERGASWVHAADEVWLAAGRALPPADDYDGYPQFENGIGLVRSFADELRPFGALDATATGEGDSQGRPDGTDSVLLTGTLFAPVLERLVSELPGGARGARVLPVSNRYLGGGVSVAGLLTGEDIVRTILDDEGEGEYFVPDIVFNGDGLTLDDRTLEMLGASANAVVRAVPADARGLLVALGRVEGEAKES